MHGQAVRSENELTQKAQANAAFFVCETCFVGTWSGDARWREERFVDASLLFLGGHFVSSGGLS